MNFFSKLLPLPLGIALAMAPQVALSATTEEISAVLFDDTTVLLNIEVDDADLAESLEADLQYALDEDVIDPDIVDEIADAVDSGEESDLDDLVGDNLIEQEQSWLEKSPELLNAFELVKFEFHQCRSQSSGGASECAQGLGFRLQVAAVNLSLEGIEERKASLDGLTGPELEEALALIAAEEEELAKKLARAEQKLARLGEGAPGSTELQAAVSSAREAGSTNRETRRENSPVTEEPDEQPGGNQGGTDRGNQGNGNSNSGNQGNSDRGNQGNNDRGARGND
jgi:hypothetical protein